MSEAEVLPSPEQVQGGLVRLLRKLADQVEGLPVERFDMAAPAPSDLLEERHRQRRLAVQVLAKVGVPLSRIGEGLALDACAPRGRRSSGLEMTHQAAMELAHDPLLRRLADDCPPPGKDTTA
ncbi:hypothetical protein ACIO3O_36875 [Streptomyces sp. NPDC087440]|uniref:hypothetical protein n=1 Tax=Streptomyces sp. NPDC087440 TaxID=3365790 RepID=UPI0037F534C3